MWAAGAVDDVFGSTELLEEYPVAKREPMASTPPPARRTADVPTSPTWWAPVMVGLMLVGLVWVVVFYITQERFPIPQLGRWNLGVGFAFMMAGFMMTTRWR